LSAGEAATGDYPIDIYLLDAGTTPQARQSLVLRVEPASGAFAAASLDPSWPAALLDMALMSLAPGERAASNEPSALFTRALRLLGEGDIAGARLLFRHLADKGESQAAYELARTFDGDVLAALGTRGIAGDRASALHWYERASQSGSAKAADRLKILASLAD
jgi:TPR repeat protein